MKLLFVSARSKKPVVFNSITFSSFLSNFSNIGVISTIQFSHLIPELKRALEKQHKKVFVYKNPNILGCNAIAAEKIQDKVDAFIFLSSGQFHTYNTATKITKPIFQLNPMTQQIREFDRTQIDLINQRKKALEKKFAITKNIGILITTKPGQQQMKEALKLKKQLEKINKNVFMFIFNNLDLNQFENFPEIQLYVNTACPGIFLDDNRIINLEQVREILKK